MEENKENQKDLLFEDEEEEEELPPAMPEKLPSLIKLLVSRTPDIYKPAVAHAVFPSLAAHLYQVSFEYVDGVEHEPEAWRYTGDAEELDEARLSEV